MKGVDLLIFGATRNTGLSIARLAVGKGERVAAMARKESDVSSLKMLGVTVVRGDAFEVHDCWQTLNETRPRRVISLMGGKNAQGRRVCGEGNINVVRALEGGEPVERFLLVTSMGCGEQYEALNDNVKKFLGEALQAKTEAENYLKKSGLPWTIVRPGGLNDEPASGNFCLLDGPDRNRKGYVSRGDVAIAALQVLDDPVWLHRAVTVQCDRGVKEVAHA